jgi:hypothetical protein
MAARSAKAAVIEEEPVSGALSPAEFRALVDNYGEVDQRLELIESDRKILLAQKKKLSEPLLAAYAELPADETAIAEGERYRVTIGAKENRRRITDLGKIFKIFGRDRFLELCDIALKKLEEGLAELKKSHLLPTLVVQERTGPRTLSAIAKSGRARKVA